MSTSNQYNFNMVALIEVKHLVKKFGNVVAVNDINFSIDPGICLGLLGPNGAGKTTTIEVIEDVIPPTSGEILYKGLPRAASFRDEVGIQFQDTALLNFLTIFDSEYQNGRQNTDSDHPLYGRGTASL